MHKFSLPGNTNESGGLIPLVVARVDPLLKVTLP